MSAPHWLGVPLILEIHAFQIERHGGAKGIRDMARLEAALDRPRNLHGYESPSLCRLAASYAHGITAGHPFVDGNKRVSLLACMIFLDRNAIKIQADDDDLYRMWVALAAGEITELDLADWLARRAFPSLPRP